MAKIEIEESEHQRLVETAGRVTTLEAERDTAVQERDAAKAEAEKSKAAANSPRGVIEAQIKETHRELAQVKARERARSVLADEFQHAWLTPTVINRLCEALLADLPVVNDELDEPALRDKAVEARNRAENEAAELLSEAGVGKPRGLGGSQSDNGGDNGVSEQHLTKTFERLGLSTEAATTAAKGR